MHTISEPIDALAAHTEAIGRGRAVLGARPLAFGVGQLQALTKRLCITWATEYKKT